jgi:alpha-mannosidase
MLRTVNTKIGGLAQGLRAMKQVSILILAALLAATSSAGEPTPLWQIGADDGRSAEFALGPRDWAKYQNDGFFVVGESDPKRDWPYVHPGPIDVWAGSRSHTFSIVFGVHASPAEGACRLVIDLIETHPGAPPRLNIEINGRAFERELPKGASFAVIDGSLAGARPYTAAVAFPAALLHAGPNRIDITTMAGSNMIYDRVALEAPASVRTASVGDWSGLGSVRVAAQPVERAGKQFRQLEAAVLRAGPPVNAVLALNGRPLEQVRLAAGRVTVRAFAPRPDLAQHCTLSLIIDGKSVAQQPVLLTPGVREVIIAFKTHFDIGYTDMPSRVIERYRTTMIDEALEVVEHSRRMPPAQQFVWTIPGWPMAEISADWAGQTAARRAKIQQAFKTGRFVVHALPFSLHTELLEPEDLVRGLGFASRVCRAAGRPLPRDAKMTDVPCHTWILPTLLRHAGVAFLHLGGNAACAPPRVPALFWWQGPDGSRLLTMHNVGYGTSTIPPADWSYQTWLALEATGDNHGPPSPDEVRQVLGRLARELPGVKVRIGRLSDFADAIVAERADVPVVRGDMPDTWIHGPMCDPQGGKVARNVRPAIAAAESLNTLLRATGVRTPDVAKTVAQAYEKSLLYSEHTWGGALYWVTSYDQHMKWGYGAEFQADRAAGRFRRLEQSWAEHTAYIENARDLVAPVLTHELQALAKAVGVEGKRVVVFNPLPWKRDGLVTVELPGAAVALKPVDGGPAVSSVADQGGLHFMARDVPPLGYRTYVPTSAGMPSSSLEVDSRTTRIENRWFRVTLDPARGAIRSLIDKRSGREMVDSAAPHGFGQYLYERFDSRDVAAFVDAYVKFKADWAINELGKPNLPTAAKLPYHAASPGQCTIRFERTEEAVAAVMRSAPSDDIAHAVSTRVILHAGQPYVDLEVTLHDKPADAWPEAGWICLPWRVAKPQFRVGRVGSVIDPTRDIVPGANRHVVAVNTGVAVFDGQGGGAGLCAVDSPLVSLDTPGCWRYSTDFVPRNAAVYVNLFNNQWSTNFRLWNGGTWVSRVRLWAFSRFDTESCLVTPALEARYPLFGAAASGPAGRLPPAQRGLEMSARGTLVSAFGPNPDGDGLLLRLWELAGRAGDCTVRLPPAMYVDNVQPVDLRGEAVGLATAVSNGEFTFRREAFAPASFVLPAKF